MRRLDGDLINQALESLGAVLTMRGQRFEIVLIGGGNLIYSGLVTRPTTQDLDLLGEMRDGQVVKLRPMPAPLADAIRDVGRQFDLPVDWINLGPDTLLDKGLPEGFVSRLEPERFGDLSVWFAARRDLVAFKLYAAANRNPRDTDTNRHFQDLADMAPSDDDLHFGRDWMETWAASDLLAEADEIIRQLLEP